jgi:hypothetical protein
MMDSDSSTLRNGRAGVAAAWPVRTLSTARLSADADRQCRETRHCLPNGLSIDDGIAPCLLDPMADAGVFQTGHRDGGRFVPADLAGAGALTMPGKGTDL